MSIKYIYITSQLNKYIICYNIDCLNVKLIIINTNLKLHTYESINYFYLQATYS